MITEALLRELLGEAEELFERHLDDCAKNRDWGSEDGELACLKAARNTKSIIRRSRKALAQMLGMACYCSEYQDQKLCRHIPGVIK